MSSGETGAQTSATGRVWDWPTRLTHWILAISVPASWITAKGFDLLAAHMVIGYVTLGVVAFRLAWGFAGPRHARFSSFLRGPAAILRYTANSLPRRDAPPAVGHNPLGALAVVVMLAMLAFQATSGLFATDELFHLGPYVGAVGEETAQGITTWHKRNGNLLLWVVGLHLAAIAFYAFYKRQNLVGPMITGRRTLPDTREAFIDGERTLLALILAAAATALVLGILALAPPPPEVDDFF